MPRQIRIEHPGAIYLVTINYDARGRESSHSLRDDAAPAITRSWDDANRLSTICNIYSTIDYKYDGAGMVREEVNTVTGSGGSAKTIYHSYPAGGISEIKYPDGLWVHRDYISRGQLKAVADGRSGSNWQLVIDYTYYRDGKVSYQDYGNGVRTTFDYDERGFTRLVYNHRKSPDGNLSHRTYYRDDRDRIKAWQKSTDTSMNGRENGRGQRYSYDAEGQLREVWYEAPNPAATGEGAWGWEGFNYDAMGNMQQNNHVFRRGWTWFARRDNGLNQYLNWSGTPISHDGNGGVIHDGWISASYNALNQPVSISSPQSGGTMWFGYDPLGRCVKRWVGPSGAATSNPATYFYYEGWNLIQEGPSATSASMLYVHGARVDEIVKQIRPSDGVGRYFQHDAQGHCILQTDNSGNLVEQYVYTAFGQPFFYDAAGNDLGHSPWGNRFLFTGREWLKDLWIYDYRHRMYQPELGRFLQPDPKHFAAGDYNLYRYCHNDPINKTDPTGLDIESAWDVFNIGLGLVSFASNAREGNWGAAALDGLGVVVDGAAAALPIVPGGAGTAIKAARVVKAAEGAADKGGLVIGKMDDLSKSTGWRKGDHTLNLPKLAPGPERRAQNAKELQHHIDKGKPIRDVSPTKAGGFLDRERALSRESGWKYDRERQLWRPGGK